MLLSKKRHTEKFLRALEFAYRQAFHRRDKHVGTEHMLYGLLKEESGVAYKVLTSLGLNTTKVLDKFGKFQKEKKVGILEGQLVLSVVSKQVMDRAWEECRAAKQTKLDTQHLLLALVRKPEYRASMILMDLGLKLEDVYEAVLDELNPGRKNPLYLKDLWDKQESVKDRSGEQEKVLLDKIIVELCAHDHVIYFRLKDEKEIRAIAMSFVGTVVGIPKPSIEELVGMHFVIAERYGYTVQFVSK